MKFSFIVPVYNVAPYLRKCVDSLLAQDYDDYEIILVNDGSTDESGTICDEYATSPLSTKGTSPFSEADHSIIPIRVIHQPNAGLSAARNTGIKAAKGEYICFVDSDDYWELNVLGGLMAQVEREKLDVLRFDYQNVNEHKDVFEPNKSSRYIDHRTDVVDGVAYLNERMSYACYAVMYIVRLELVPTFTEGILYEDTEWSPRMLVAAKRVNATQTVVYNYLTREGSITKKYDKKHIQKKNDSLMQVNLSMQNLLVKVTDGRWINGCIADNVYSILNNVASYDYTSVSYWVDALKRNSMFPIRGYNVRRMTFLRYRLINLSPKLYCWLRHIRTTYL